ncbi:hypothetical protein FN846DRAFT_678926 [Sphaerosporella brunnea]|uniref:Uncharacterized protein n=1 Tax=Sphaerosporella brunnea TaxID=1250544 RepID=A0A5J5FAR8_9PEZI|nr:hypothetical protein FN846DRAFT_678926 [Sphaerosporella brunnea]
MKGPVKPRTSIVPGPLGLMGPVTTVRAMVSPVSPGRTPEVPPEGGGSVTPTALLWDCPGVKGILPDRKSFNQPLDILQQQRYVRRWTAVGSDTAQQDSITQQLPRGNPDIDSSAGELSGKDRQLLDLLPPPRAALFLLQPARCPEIFCLVGGPPCDALSPAICQAVVSQPEVLPFHLCSEYMDLLVQGRIQMQRWIWSPGNRSGIQAKMVTHCPPEFSSLSLIQITEIEAISAAISQTAGEGANTFTPGTAPTQLRNLLLDAVKPLLHDFGVEEVIPLCNGPKFLIPLQEAQESCVGWFRRIRLRICCFRILIPKCSVPVTGKSAALTLVLFPQLRRLPPGWRCWRWRYLRPVCRWPSRRR